VARYAEVRLVIGAVVDLARGTSSKRASEEARERRG